MIICIGNVLNPHELARVTRALEAVRFVDGRATAGWHAAQVKKNTQAEGRSPEVAELQNLVLEALKRNVLFQLAARPRRIHLPLFSRYRGEMQYGAHVDDAVMGAEQLRTDIAFTLFLSDPASYDGGELVMDTTGGEQVFKLDAGAAIVYPASTLHRVMPVTRGERLACVSWVQSLVRDPAQRELLFDLDTARRTLFDQQGKTREFDLLSKSLANLLRMWAEV
jgi:PKHD-type hydroxylase